MSARLSSNERRTPCRDSSDNTQFDSSGAFVDGDDDFEAECAAMLSRLSLQPSERADSAGRLDHYEVLSVVGTGAMGVVVRAFDDQLHREVAVKVMSPFLMSSTGARQRFFREARAAAQINHANVIIIHAVAAEDAPIPYLVMEFVEGESLHDFIAENAPLDPSAVLRISAQIASGLAAAHQHGVIHRDVKPANILLEDDIDRVKIADFGLARVMEDHSDLTSLGAMIGTPAYMSPEQVNGLPLDARSDLFGLGCVMYAMIAGQSPFCASNPLTAARRVTGESPAPLPALDATIPRFLRDVIDRLLEKDPDKRFQSAGEVVSLLNTRLLAGTQGDQEASRLDAVSPSPVFRTPGRVRNLAVMGLPVLLLTAAIVWVLVTGGKQEKMAPLVVVGQSPEADVSTINKALMLVAPGGTIRVVGADTYEETVLINDAERHNSIRIEAVDGALLRAPTAHPVVLRIDSVPGVTVSGLRIEYALEQHAIEIVGAVAGCRIEHCEIFQSPEFGSRVGAIFVHDATGSPNAPIELVDLEIHCGAVGIVISEQELEPVRWLNVSRSTVRSSERDSATLVVVAGMVEHITLERNICSSGQTGISFLFQEAGQSRAVVVSRNSFHDLSYAWSLNNSVPEQEILIDSNLIIDTAGIRVQDRSIDEFGKWFDRNSNWWEAGSQIDRTAIGWTARIVDHVLLRSRDPEDNDYLQPGEGADAGTPGRFSQ